MLTITLQFKSIEAARAALLEIPSSSLVGGEAAENTPPARATPEKQATENVAAKKQAAATTQTTASVADAPEKKTPSVAASGTTHSANADSAKAGDAPKPEATTSLAKPSESVEYPVLQKAVFTLASRSREKAAAVAASFGVKTFKELPEDKWFAALTAVNAALEEKA